MVWYGMVWGAQGRPAESYYPVDYKRREKQKNSCATPILYPHANGGPLWGYAKTTYYNTHRRHREQMFQQDQLCGFYKRKA